MIIEYQNCGNFPYIMKYDECFKLVLCVSEIWQLLLCDSAVHAFTTVFTNMYGITKTYEIHFG